MPREVQVTIDRADLAALAAFRADAPATASMEPPPGFVTWDEALDAFGVPPERRNDVSAVVDPDGSGPREPFQRVPEGSQVKNRVHLDVRAAPGLTGGDRMASLEDAAVRLVAVGATRLQRFEPNPPLLSGHLVMADPRATSSAPTDRRALVRSTARPVSVPRRARVGTPAVADQAAAGAASTIRPRGPSTTTTPGA